MSEQGKNRNSTKFDFRDEDLAVALVTQFYLDGNVKAWSSHSDSCIGYTTLITLQQSPFYLVVMFIDMREEETGI